MKIVCMIGTPPYLNYFINEIAKHHEITLVIRENSHAGILQKIRKKGLRKSLRLIMQRLKNGGRFEQDYNELLGDSWKNASPAIPLINVADINSEEVRTHLAQIKPHLILVHGTSMISNKTLDGIPLVLNLHWGLSPYYRGSYCTEWALLHQDPLNIGFTIHRVSAKIDAGDILTQGRTVIVDSDTANRINMKLTRDGTRTLVKVIERLKTGKEPIFQQQDDSVGKLYLVKHFTDEKKKEAAHLENPELMSAMIAQPSRQALPIIQQEDATS